MIVMHGGEAGGEGKLVKRPCTRQGHGNEEELTDRTITEYINRRTEAE